MFVAPLDAALLVAARPVFYPVLDASAACRDNSGLMPGPPTGEMPPMPSREKLIESTEWCQKHTTGDEKGQAQIFLDRLFQAFGQLRIAMHARLG